MIVLIGPPGAGTTAAGRELAARLGAAFTDTDEQVEAAAGKPVADVFLEDGEQAFRDLERQAATLALAGEDEVVALGSGAVLDETVRAALTAKARTIVYLEASFADVAKAAGLDRPRVVLPGNPRGRLRAMLAERGPLYASLATITVQAGDIPPEVLAEEIAGRLTSADRDSDVVEGSGGSGASGDSQGGDE